MWINIHYVCSSSQYANSDQSGETGTGGNGRQDVEDARKENTQTEHIFGTDAFGQQCTGHLHRYVAPEERAQHQTLRSAVPQKLAVLNIVATKINTIAYQLHFSLPIFNFFSLQVHRNTSTLMIQSKLG